MGAVGDQDRVEVVFRSVHRRLWRCAGTGYLTRAVIAPDLSNLPPGQTAVDPRTGERFVKGADDEEPPA